MAQGSERKFRSRSAMKVGDGADGRFGRRAAVEFPRKLASSAAACRATPVPQIHCAGADDRPAARRGKSRPFEKVREIPDAAKSAIQQKTSGGIKSCPRPADALPSACPSSPTRPCPRRAGHLAGCSPRRWRHAPSTPTRCSSTSTPARARTPAATLFRTLHAGTAVETHARSPSPCSFPAFFRPRSFRTWIGPAAALADFPHALAAERWRCFLARKPEPAKMPPEIKRPTKSFSQEPSLRDRSVVKFSGVREHGSGTTGENFDETKFAAERGRADC